MERMRSNQRLARSGVLIAMFAGMAFFQVRDLFKDNALLMVGVLLSAVSSIIIVLTALPFLRSPCENASVPITVRQHCYARRSKQHLASIMASRSINTFPVTPETQCT
ncbi:hypothetical protein ASF90_10055 [Xanthomonas sp. Leaf148]|nr:hypothetical protein ASF90_10055 [Xanthomonas sp. Leaf148]